jgi:formylglycine-generating enzyme required for sulfatase activity
VKNTVADYQADNYHKAAHQRIPEIFSEKWASDWGQDRYGPWMWFRYKGVLQYLRWIMPGEFKRDSPQSEPDRNNSEQQQEVILIRGFYMQATEVTQGQWQEVMGSNPSFFNKCGNDCPVEHVSWGDAQDFIEKLNAKEDIGKYQFAN